MCRMTRDSARTAARSFRQRRSSRRIRTSGRTQRAFPNRSRRSPQRRPRSRIILQPRPLRRNNRLPARSLRNQVHRLPSVLPARRGRRAITRLHPHSSLHSPKSNRSRSGVLLNLIRRQTILLTRHRQRLNNLRRIRCSLRRHHRNQLQGREHRRRRRQRKARARSSA